MTTLIASQAAAEARRAGNSRLTPTQLSTHLACAHYTQLERKRRAGELQIDFMPDPRLQAMRMRGAEHERAYIERLRETGSSIVDLRERRGSQATIAAMREGAQVIVQATLGNDEFSGIADVLVKVDVPSTLGAWSYEPVDTKLARETRAGTILQLCTYCEMLDAMQGVQPARFHVVTPMNQEAYRTADFAAYFRLIRSRLGSAVTAVPAPNTYPDPVTHCDVCNYWKHCDDQRRRDDHPSLIADIRTAQTREFQRQGISTLTAIARSEGRLPADPARGTRSTFERLGHQARLQLQARSLPLPPVDALPLEPLRGLQRLPEPSPGDIYLDFEGDPFVGDHGLEYLTGYVWRDAEGLLRLEQDWALDAAAEKAACERFIDFVTARLKEHPALHIYHFGAYEPSALKRLCARHATRGEELDRLLRGGCFVDLHAVVREAFRIGIERYGLKELEPLHQFRRKIDLRDAALARQDLELAIELGDEERITPELNAQVAAYNGEDCLSTEALQRWLEARRAELVAAGQSIARPAHVSSEPSQEVSERDKRIASLQTALTAGLPANSEERTPEQSARALLASMLGYCRQEEKNAWWEFFRLRDLPVADQLEEREMLARLEFLAVMPKQGKERNARHQYRFPPQDTAIDVGNQVVFTKAEDPYPDGMGTSLTVTEIDYDGCTVVFSIGAKAGDARPTAVFRHQVVGGKPIENALLSFAESVRDHGFQSSGPFAAASQLLLRLPPRLGSGPDFQKRSVPTISDLTPNLRRPEEPVLEAAKRVCKSLDGGVLPIQGPPGSGKTYVGARAIAELARTKRVGVTAVSHKVIDNLLKEIRDSLPAGALRLVHKHEDEALQGIEYLDNNAATLSAVRAGTVVGATVWLWSSDDAEASLDYLFIDEAGQMSLAHALAASRAARNVVLLGDPQQLEQPTKGAHPEGADVAALVHVLGKDRATLADDQGLFLDRTWRLHPDICAFTSELYYESRLRSIDGLERQRLDGDTPFAGAGPFLVEVAHEGNQSRSNEEIDAVERIVRHLLAGTQWTDQEGRTRPLEPSDVLVVAPYNAQVSALRRTLAPLGVIRVGTVDKFQGQEAAIVIYSCTASSPQDAPRGMAFLYDPHRFNVATSRARGAVIVVSSPALFEADCRTPEQMRWANGLCRYKELAKVAKRFT
ncbi:MAG TPA: TM0106 family RecB-like putative nuclease [Burkholderiales bacterium]|nr:TM0106 family RecB-like putative nuclease [Burkholderiales bacterium]